MFPILSLSVFTSSKPSPHLPYCWVLFVFLNKMDFLFVWVLGKRKFHDSDVKSAFSYRRPTLNAFQVLYWLCKWHRIALRNQKPELSSLQAFSITVHSVSLKIHFLIPLYIIAIKMVTGAMGGNHL